MHPQLQGKAEVPSSLASQGAQSHASRSSAGNMLMFLISGFIHAESMGWKDERLSQGSEKQMKHRNYYFKSAAPRLQEVFAHVEHLCGGIFLRQRRENDARILFGQPSP